MQQRRARHASFSDWLSLLRWRNHGKWVQRIAANTSDTLSGQQRVSRVFVRLVTTCEVMGRTSGFSGTAGQNLGHKNRSG